MSPGSKDGAGCRCSSAFSVYLAWAYCIYIRKWAWMLARRLAHSCACASRGLSIRISSLKSRRGLKPEVAKKGEAPVVVDSWLFAANSASDKYCTQSSYR